MYFAQVEKDTNYVRSLSDMSLKPIPTDDYYEVEYPESFVFSPPVEVAYWLYDKTKNTFSFVGYKPSAPAYPILSEIGKEHQSNDVFFVSTPPGYNYFVYKKCFRFGTLNGGSTLTLGITNLAHGITNLNNTDQYPLYIRAHLIESNGVISPIPAAYGSLLNGYVTVSVDATNIMIKTNMSLTGVKAFVELQYTKANSYYM